VQAARSEIWPSNEQGGTAADGEKRAGEERNRSKAEARSHEAPLGEVRLSEERLPSSQQSDWLRCPQAEESILAQDLGYVLLFRGVENIRQKTAEEPASPGC
jgi:hypothetical protein